jgi:hypothetical protein
MQIVTPNLQRFEMNKKQTKLVYLVVFFFSIAIGFYLVELLGSVGGFDFQGNSLLKLTASVGVIMGCLLLAVTVLKKILGNPFK